MNCRAFDASVTAVAEPPIPRNGVMLTSCPHEVSVGTLRPPRTPENESLAHEVGHGHVDRPQRVRNLRITRVGCSSERAARRLGVPGESATRQASPAPGNLNMPYTFDRCGHRRTHDRELVSSTLQNRNEWPCARVRCWITCRQKHEIHGTTPRKVTGDQPWRSEARSMQQQPAWYRTAGLRLALRSTDPGIPSRCSIPEERDLQPL